MPESVATLIAFLLFFTPGLAFELMRERRREARDYSAFRETSVVVLASVTFSAAACAVLYAIASEVEPGWLPDADLLTADPAGYFDDKVFLLTRTVVLEVLLATSFAAVAHILLRATSKDGTVLPNSAWYETTIGRGNAAGGRVWTEVVLTDGTVVTGYMMSNHVKRGELREVVLWCADGDAPMTMRRSGGETQDLPDWDYYVLPASSIHRTALALVANDDNSKLSWWRRGIVRLCGTVAPAGHEPPPNASDGTVTPPGGQ